VIGVDTNVLLRLFIDDDHKQHQAVVRFFEARTSKDTAFISLITVVEFVWVLKRVYQRPQSEALGLLQRVIASEDAVVESVDRIRQAIALAMETDADFSDVLIANAGAVAGCRGTVTFDGAAAKLVPGMELLK
jgi:predicted nucleic-acid-binding protein